MCWMCQKGLALRAAARVDVVRSLTCLQVAGCLCSGGASMTTDKHVDPAAAVPTGDEEEDSNLQDVPEGAVRFELEPADIEEALAAPSMQVRSPNVTCLDTIHILTLLHQHGCVHLASSAALLRASLQSQVPFSRISMTGATYLLNA